MVVFRALALALVFLGDGDLRWQLDLPDGWKPADAPDAGAGTTMGSWAGDGERRLVIARLRGNTDGAYAGQRSWWSGLEDGVRESTEGYKRLSSRALKLGKKKQIPAYDLWYRARGGVRGSRFVMFRGRAVVATIDLPHARKVEAGAKKILESFIPSPAPAP
jgi:hypothetical protein